MSEFNFENPSRQSAKGILVIFGVSVFKVGKGIVIAGAALVLKYLQSGKGPDLTQPIFIISVLAIAIFFLIIAILRYLNFKFFLKEDYFFLQKGIINKEEISVSFGRIQNVYIKQNLLQQLINVVSLAIETAGDDKTEIEITALSKTKAMALKSKLLAEVKAQNTNSDEYIMEQCYDSDDAEAPWAQASRYFPEGKCDVEHNGNTRDAQCPQRTALQAGADRRSDGCELQLLCFTQFGCYVL
jgi:putative membrane protein